MSRVDTSNLQVRIEFMPTTKVAFVRHVGPYENANDRFRRFVAWAEQRGLLDSDTRYLGVCHDDPAETPPDRIRYDCAITVGSDFRPENDVQVGNVFGGEYAITTYRGPYSDFGAVYDWLFTKWLPQNNREAMNGPTIEMYMNDAETTPAADLLTGICIPLEWW